MQRSQKSLVILFVFLPFLMSMVMGITPNSEKLLDTWQRIRYPNNGISATDIILDYKFILSQQPWHFDLWEQLANIQEDIEDYYGVIDSYHHLQEYKELGVSDQLALTNAYFQTNQNELALQLLNQITEKDLTYEEYNMVYTEQQLHKDWYSAYQTLLLMAKKEPQDAFVLYQLGLSQLIFDPENAGDTLFHAVTNNTEYSSRVRIFRNELEKVIHQENLTYRLVLTGQLLSQQGEWDYATAAFEYATKLDPEYAEGWALLGNALKYVDEDGFPELKRAQEIDPNSKIVKEMLALYWRDNNDILQSLTILNELTSEDPNEAFWHYEIGNTLIHNGDLYGALDAFKEATNLAPDDIFYWKSLAQFTVDYKISMDTTGITAARQALILVPDDAIANDLLGVIYLNLENYANSERFLILAYEEEPLSPIVNLHLGQLYLKLGRVNDSFEYLTRSMNLAQNEETRMIAENFLATIK